MENINAECLITEIINCNDISKEYESVERLLKYLKNWRKAASQQEDLETSFLQKGIVSETQVSFFPQEFLRNKNILDKLTFYTFRRRFGWSEKSLQQDCSHSGQNVPDGNNKSIFDEMPTSVIPLAQESKIKKMLNEKLDELIQLYASEEELSLQILKSYNSALLQAQDLAVVRSQLLFHVFEWFSFIISETSSINSQEFLLVKSLIVSGVTDVWSAIRSCCVSKMSHFIEYFSIPHLKKIFQTLMELCHVDDNHWQSKEGAIMAIGVILQSFKLAVVPKSYIGILSNDASDTIVCRKFGSYHFESLPDFITEPLHDVLYHLLSSNQLSIREHANKSFSFFLLRSDFQQVFKSFRDVILHLAKEAFLQATQKTKHVEASCVDGFLKLAEFLIKQIPIENILNNWQLCFATFSYYLMHPASTIRQAASSVFKFIVAKQTSNLLLPLLVIKSLPCGWKTDINSLKRSSLVTKGRPSLPSQRNSVQCLEVRSRDEVDVTELWEWREGRLLAYELILKFFISNHIHYTFPAYTITRDVADVDNSMDQRSAKRKGLANHHKFSMSHNMKSQKDHQSLRYEGLSRSLTMECDPFTQKFISSLAEKDRITDQTSSLLESLRKKDKSMLGFDDLKEDNSETDGFPHVTQEMIRHFEASSIDDTNLSGDHCSLDDTSFGRILIQIFLQTLESVADSRWEIRRMAYQVFPLISETMRFYDARILENLWESHLSVNSSKLVYGACLSLKDSLSHAAKLATCFENPPGFWKDLDRCLLAARQIVASINEKLPKLLPRVAKIVQRPNFDKLTITAIEVLILSAIHFPQKSLEGLEQLSDVMHKLESLFILAYPENSYAVFLCGTLGQDLGQFDTPRKGFLSCTTKVSSLPPNAKQVHDYFYEELQKLLPLYVRHCSHESVIDLLPIILKETALLIDSSIEVQSLFQACHEMLKHIANIENRTQKINTILNYACCEVCKIIETQNLEMHFLRQYFDVLLDICHILKNKADLKIIFTSIISMLNSGDYLFDLHEDVDKNEQNEEEILRIQFLSNDIRQSPINQFYENNKKEDNGTERDLLESQALGNDLNFNSNFEKRRSSSPYCRMDSPFQDDCQSDSDWDDWEDEKEDVFLLQKAIGSFLVNLRENQGSSFDVELQTFELKEQKLLERLLIV